MALPKIQEIRQNISQMNYNVKLVFLFTFLQSLGRGIWSSNVLSSFIFIVAENSSVVFGLRPNEVLGLTSAATGIAMTLTVLPAGILSDKFQRKSLLRTASIFGATSMIVMIFADQIMMIFIGLLFWGIFQGISRPSLESIFGDSTESGNRSNIYAWNHTLRQFAMASGPFVNVFLFLIFGDVWEVEVLKSVMFVGIIISIISLFFLLFFDDKRSLGEESETIEFNETSKHSLSRNSKYIITILLLSNLIIGFGAGMTIKFFPVFFMEIYILAPIAVQLINGFTNLITGVTSIYAQKLSIQNGRALMIFIVQAIATGCLFIISFYPPLILLAPVFIARGSLMNASQPLSRSILMDVVPKKHRGKVNSFQALAWGMFWNFSAALGGFLIGDNNYRLCFVTTTGLYVIGTAIILFLIPLVKKEKELKLIQS